jgi:hypothetical protein
MSWPHITRQHYDAQKAARPGSIAKRPARRPVDPTAARAEHARRPAELASVQATKVEVAELKPIPVADSIAEYLKRRPKTVVR